MKALFIALIVYLAFLVLAAGLGAVMEGISWTALR